MNMPMKISKINRDFERPDFLKRNDDLDEFKTFERDLASARAYVERLLKRELDAQNEREAAIQKMKNMSVKLWDKDVRISELESEIKSLRRQPAESRAAIPAEN
ncbi:MAG: hypothetical protein K2H64_04555 [Desulfovibrio sp.]|nr:hypothetical protein [Desulfovibrio sp.]